MADQRRPYAGYGLPAEAEDPVDPVSPPPPPSDDARRWRALRPWILGGVVVLLVAVVGIWWVARTPLGVLGRAVAGTLDAGSARVEVAATATGVPFLGELELVVADGVVEFDSGESRLERELLGGVRTELRRVDEGVFVEIPLSDARWVRVANAGDLPGAGVDPTTIVPDLTNPVALVGIVARLDMEPTELGTRELDGRTVTDYEVILDLEAAADLVDGQAADTIARLRRFVGSPTLPLRVSLDEDLLIRELAFTADVTVPGVLTTPIETRLAFSDFGLPVDVVAPPSDQIVELDAELQRLLDPLGEIRGLLGG